MAWIDFIPIALAVAVPAVTAMAFVIRYFWNKEKCFVKMANTIKTLTQHDGDSSETHTDFAYRLTEIEKRQAKNEIYLKLQLKHNKIEYSE
jgi:hypothetical protein